MKRSLPEQISVVSHSITSAQQHYVSLSAGHESGVGKESQLGSLYGYNVAKALKIFGPLEKDDLQTSLNALLKEQPVLRSSFSWKGSGVDSIKLREVNVKEQELCCVSTQDYQSVILQEMRKPFNLAVPPLLRVTLITLAPQQFVLLVVAHSSICDSTSLALILQRLLHPPNTPSSSTSYYEYIQWETQSHQEQHVINYWKQKVGGSLQILQFPLDRSKAPEQSFECSSSSLLLNSQLSANTIKLADQFGVNGLFSLLLTTYKILLHRHTGEEDICVGSKRYCRSYSSSSNSSFNKSAMIGPIDDHYIYRSFLSDDFTFIQALENVISTVEQAQNKPISYFELLKKIHGHEGLNNPTPFFKTEFNISDSSNEYVPASDKIRLEPVSIPISFSPYDLRITISGKTESQISIKADYNTELILQNRIEEFLNQFQLLLEQVTANPNDRIVSYNLITESASKIIPSPKVPLCSLWRGSIQDHFAARAKADPSRLAIYFEQKEVSYGELFNRSNQVANFLIKKGIKPGDVIGLYGHRSPAVVVCIMGILSAGASYCIMDPAYPTERIKQCMDIAKPKGWLGILAVPSDLQDYLTSLSLLLQETVPQPWEKSNVFEGVPTDYPAVSVDPESVAVITFTSGSTGIPKGVMGRHTPLTHYYPWMKEEFGIAESDRFSACSGIAHDPLQRDIFTPLFFGASIYIPTQEDISQPGRLSKWFKTHSINISCFTPAIGQILTTGISEELRLESLRLAFFVGDCLLKKDVALLHNLAPNITVINMYGSTETQRSVGYYKVPRHLSTLKEVVLVGKGMQGCQLILLNKSNKLAGIGEVAEIYIRSHHLAKGYVGLPEETEKKFLPNPFSNIPGDRLYRTGDIGRYNLEGDVDCTGRADDQIKIRGFRIELGEISAALGKHPTVKENVTIVRQDKPGEKQLASYVVPWPGMKCESAEIKLFLKTKLPNYMIPTFIVELTALPLTPNGKIDRKALPKPVSDAVDTATLTETERTLLELWTKSMGRNVPTIDSNFFDLGGHSLLVTQITSDMKKIWKSDKINMSLIYKAPTIKELAHLLDSLISPSPSSSVDPTTDKDSIDYLIESRLNEDIRIRTDLLPSTTKAIKNVFLTGGTGFLGSFLISSILSNYADVNIYCLVRASSLSSAKERLFSTMASYAIFNETTSSRIIPVVGDLSKERLGLDTETWTTLSQTIDLVIHNGAIVHWLHSYSRLKGSNIGGTEEALRFSVLGKLKYFHYISTTNVYDAHENRKLKVVLEDKVGDATDGLGSGYTQTKWVAEKLVMKAKERGIPCRIYRPSYITGDTKNGIWNGDDFLCRFIKGCIQMKLAPSLASGVTLDMSPVDYVANAIVYTVFKTSSSDYEGPVNFNVVQDDLYSYEDWFNCVKGYGYPLEVVEYSKWVVALKERENDNSFALKPFFAYFTDNWPESLKGPRYDTSNIRQLLQKTEIKNATMQSIMHKYFSYFIRCGFLTPPEKPLTDSVVWNPTERSKILERSKNLS